MSNSKPSRADRFCGFEASSKKIALISLVAFMVLAPFVQGAYENTVFEAEKNYTCIGNTLNIWANVTRCVNGTCTATTFNQSIDCPYGCDTTYMKCSPPQFDRYLYILAFIIGAFVLLMIVGAKRR